MNQLQQRKTAGFIILMLVVTSPQTTAQQMQRPPFDPPTSTRSLRNEWPVPSVLERETSDLGIGRATLQDTLTESAQLPSARRSVLLDSLRRRLTITNQKRQMKYSEINKRLDRLEGVLLRRQQPLPATPKPLSTMPEPTPPVELIPPKQVEPEPQPESEPQPTPPEEPEASAFEQSLPAPPVVVTESAVDRIALADNLFASDQMEMSLKLYFELSTEKLGARDLIWIHYQIGSASRRLRNLEQARKHYRIVAGQKTDGLYPRLSRWWLDTIQRRLALENQHGQIAAAVSTPANSKVTNATQP
ncbi:MAG: hypothetical protein AB8G99_12940 [Planctomycetaceae bacterium]